MSDNEGGKKSVYRLEYASIGRSKCTGERYLTIPSPFTRTPVLTVFHASSSRHRTQTVRVNQVVMVVHYFSRLHRCKGTPIGKGELRFGSLIDFQGKTSL